MIREKVRDGVANPVPLSYPCRLYKFVSPERTDTLRNQAIRFTQPTALNDPFELLPMFEQLMPEEEIRQALNPPFELLEEALRKHHATLTTEKQSQIPVELFVSLVRSNPQLVKAASARFEPIFRTELDEFAPRAKAMLSEVLRSKVGILSLSDTVEQPLLWAHYAAAHKGFAIEFDAHHDFFDRRRFEKDELFHLRKVKYADRSIRGRTLRDIDGDDLLVTKAASWSYEAEWRMLAPLEAAERLLQIDDEDIYLFAFPAAAVSAVVLGARSPPAVVAELEQLLCLDAYRHARLCRAALDATSQRIKIKEIHDLGEASNGI